MAKQRQIEIQQGKGKSKVIDMILVDVTDVPHTELMIHKSLSCSEDEPNYVISHKHSGWAVLHLCTANKNKKSMIGAAQHLWSMLPSKIKTLLSTTDKSGRKLQSELDELYESDSQLKPKLAQAIRSTRMYLDSQL